MPQPSNRLVRIREGSGNRGWMFAGTVLAAVLLTHIPARAQESTTLPTPVVVTEGDFGIFRSDGTPATMDDMLDAAAKADVVFVGENHNDPVAHYMELQVLQGVDRRSGGDRVALSMEMFARDVQYIVDEYLAGLITETHFRSSSNPWNNYETDYRPLVEYARENGLDVVAANSPRRYTNRVTREGRGALRNLSPKARSFLAPLPYGMASDQYRREWIEVMGGDTVSGSMPETMHGMSTANMLDAQSLWDATMAFSIAEYLLSHPGAHVVHAVGSFHVNRHTGTPEQFQAYRPGVRTLVISVATVKNVTAFDDQEHAGLGDFVVLADESLPRTY